MAALTLNLNLISELSRSQFRQLALDNPDMRLEHSRQGHLIIMDFTGGETNNWNSELNLEVGLWNHTHQIGKTFDSSTGFELTAGSDQSPDVAWIPLAKWKSLIPQKQQGFLLICPGFVIELMSKSDSWPQTQAKMLESMKSGCRLGLLLDLKSKTIYRSRRSLEILTAPDTLSGEDIVPRFLLDARFL